MIIEPKFPASLLDASPKEQLGYFDSQIVFHSHLQQAYSLALDCIEFSAQGEIVPIVGPTGVGTTELARELWCHFLDEPATVSETGQLLPSAPVIGIEAPSQAGRIDADYWRRLLAELLRRGGDILIDRKVYVPPSEFTLTHQVPFADPRKGGIDTLVQATASMLNHRKTRIVLINHAGRLFPERDPAGSSRSQQILMDLSSRTSTRFVLIGNYQLARTSCDRNHWLHRQHLVHLRRYDKKNAEETVEFSRSVVELLSHIPIRKRPKSISAEAAEKIYLATVGCFGSLKRSLLVAMQHSQRSGEEMTEKFLLRFMPSVKVAYGITQDALQGEQLLMDMDIREIENLLSMTTPGKGAAATSASKTTSPTGGRFNSLRIGERKPSRDPVGGLRGKQQN